MKKKLVFVFNKFFLDFLKDLKDVLPNECSIVQTIRAKYGVFDKQTRDHIERVAASLNESVEDSQIQVLEGHTFGDIRAAVAEVCDGEYAADTYAYLLIMKIFAYMYVAEYEGGGDSVNVVLQVIKRIKEEPETDLNTDPVLDDTLIRYLTALKTTLADAKKDWVDVEVLDVKDEPCDKNTDNAQSFFDNSIIGTLAKEISEEIDVSELDLSDPSELLNFQNISQPNSALGKVVSSVGAKLQQKMAKGNLSQADLLGDAMKVMSMFNMQPNGSQSQAGGGMDPSSIMSTLGSLMTGFGGTQSPQPSRPSRSCKKHKSRKSSQRP